MRLRAPGLFVILCTLLASPVAAQQRSALQRAAERPLEVPTFRLAPLDAIFVTQPFTTWVADWTASTRALLATNQRGMLTRHRLTAPEELAEQRRLEAQEAEELAALRTRSDTVAFLPPLAPRRQRDPNMLTGVIGDNADLGIRIQGTSNLAGAWTRYKPCDPGSQITCQPGRFPELKPDMEFVIRAAGTVSERVHVDVDYDQTREFDAANNINVYYQGLPDEILRRVEVGDVSMRLPSSRYLTRGVPAGNFGLMAAAQVGPLDFQTLIAQQKGAVTTKEFRLGTGGQAGVEQDAELVIDDADYLKGQFFFIVPPADIGGYPHIDVLGLLGTDAPASVRPAIGGSIQVYRDERLTGQAGAQPGFFLAEAMPPTGTLRHTGSFRRLIQEQDYIVHSSGLWIMLRSPLRSDEALAVAFVTETGDTVGRMNAEATPPGTTPLLRLLRGPSATHQPGAGTWEMEMHQVYRLDSSTDVDLARIDLVISLGGIAGGRTFRDVLGQQVPFLRFFGLDEESPADRIDAAQVFQPARDGFGGGVSGQSIGGTYVVFPTLRPFAAPGPIESMRLSAADLLAALGRDANDAIYDDVDPVNRAAGARFQLNFKYRVKLDGIVSQFSLGAFGLREGSERLYLGSRPLERNIDYQIDYEIGTVTLMNPAGLFATSPGADLRATWEQKPLFSIAPTTVFGATARFALGPRGEVNFMALHQAEKTLMARPQLGVEPGSALVGGMSGRFELGGALLDRMVGSIPGMRSVRPSSAAITGEVAFSAPNPNRSGLAYLDDFESTDELSLGLRRQDWKLGSAPQSSDADRGTLPFTLDAQSALPIVWQHDFLQDGAVRGALYPATHIDRGINLFGDDRPETVMWLTFGRLPGSPDPLPPPTDARRWRSITTVLSPTGRDMSRSEYLEFYVSAGSAEPLALIFDVGTVSEDAFYVDSLGRTSGTYDDGRPWGLGILDEEARLIDREVWGTDRDQRGLWDQNCRAEPATTYPLGDARANCTRNNGWQDSEDLNGNGILDGDDGQYFRYVVQLDRMSEFLVRDTAATQTGYRLYRIPLRNGVPVNGANDATWRFIRHMRMTVVGEPTTVRIISIARMRIVGSRWTKRDVHGVQRGLLEAEPGLSSTVADVRVGPVSALTDGTVYRGPPGIDDRAQDPTQQFGRGGLEINEKSLRLAYTDLGAGDRAEVYFRYPQQPRNLLTYRELRLWVLPREGEWGPGAGERFSVRIGTDPNNFYLYQSPLRPATGPRAVTAADWLPEIVIDFQKWFDLKAEAERLLIERGPRTMGVDTLWSADSTYAIVLEDRARAPNLAAVRELVFAVYNGGAGPAAGEVWINDLRVGIPDTRAGGAGNVALDIVAGDLLNAGVSLTNQGSLFRQINETPSYVAGSGLAFNADARLDKLLPASWGLDLPLSVSHARTGQRPTFLSATDVQADQLEGLRSEGSDATRVGVRVAKRTPTANPWIGLILDGSALRMSYTRGTNRSLMTRSENSGFAGDLSYRRDIARRSFSVVPDFLEDALRAVSPAAFENSAVFQRLVNSRLRYTPASISFGSAYDDQLTRSYRFDRILDLPDDTTRAFESPRRGLRNDAQLNLRPFEPMNLSLGIASDRDLLDPERASTRLLEQGALRAARSSLGGVDFGWERGRALNSAFTYRPDLARWLRAEYSFQNRYTTDRSPSYLELTIVGNDTTAEMQRRFESSRQISRRVQFQTAGLLNALRMDSTSRAFRSLRRLETVDFQWRGTLSSQFDRQTFTPGAGYQFGLGSIDDFYAIGADTASRAQLRDEFRVNAGFAVIGAVRADLGFHTADTESRDVRGGIRTTEETGWPKATISWRPQRMQGPFEKWLSTFSFTTGVERIERRSDFANQPAQRRGVNELRFPFSVTLGLPRGFTAMYRASYSTGETLDPTGNAESSGMQHDLTLSAVVQLPDSWKNRFSRPIAMSFTFAQQDQRQCRFSTVFVEEGCIALLDVGTRTANLFVESAIRDVTVGMQMNYVGRANHIGTRNTTSQFQLGFYGRFNITAGHVPQGTLPR